MEEWSTDIPKEVKLVENNARIIFQFLSASAELTVCWVFTLCNTMVLPDFWEKHAASVFRVTGFT
jgi:hypothetical protein